MHMAASYSNNYSSCCFRYTHILKSPVGSTTTHRPLFFNNSNFSSSSNVISLHHYTQEVLQKQQWRVWSNSQDQQQDSTPSLLSDHQQEQEQEADDSCLPSDLEGAVRQSGQASAVFVNSGGLRAIVELLIPQLQFLDDEGAQAKLWDLSRLFLETLIEETGCQRVKAVFPDAGAAALLKYRWQDATFGFASLSDRKPVSNEDEIVVMVVPDYQMLEYVERIASQLSDDPPRPLIMWNPRLISEDVGVGFNVRKLRRYFLRTFTPVYSMRPLPSGAVFRSYPGLWKVFFDDKVRPSRYRLAKELVGRPDAEDLEIIFGNADEKEEAPSYFDKATSIFSSMNRFMKVIAR